MEVSIKAGKLVVVFSALMLISNTIAMQPIYYISPPKQSLIGSTMNLTFQAGILLGAFYLFDRFFLNGKIIAKIEAAKTELKDHVSKKINHLKNILTRQIDNVRGDVRDLKNDVDDMKNQLNRIDKNTSNTNSLLKTIDKSKVINQKKKEKKN